MGLKLTAVGWDQEPRVRALAKECGEYVKSYRSIRGLRAMYDAHEVFVAHVDGVDMGFAVVHHLKRTPATTIHEIGIVPTHQRRGYGEQFVAMLLYIAPSNRLRLVCDERNVAGLAFYERVGFKAQGLRKNRAGEVIVDLLLG